VTPLTRRAAQWRFLVLTALRWGPVGLFIPVFVLLPLDRGLTLSEVGLTVAVQGLVVLMLELPTGGLADAWGRRPVLVLAGIVAVASTALFLSASSVAGFALAYLLQGVYRALDSGPLEAWYVDAVHVANDGDRDRHGTEREIERGLSRAGAVLGVAIAAGALAGGGLVALGGVGPFEAFLRSSRSSCSGDSGRRPTRRCYRSGSPSSSTTPSRRPCSSDRPGRRPGWRALSARRWLPG
jgi:MFS transporter, DHA1 family, tetracycline resistance protein